MSLLSDPGFWVGVSFLLFVALIIYLKVPGKVTKALDDRADGIREELDAEARAESEEESGADSESADGDAAPDAEEPGRS